MLVTGATGFIGSRLSALAMTRGYVVRTLSRLDWDSVPGVPIDRRYFGNLPDQIPESALEGVDVVVHCAASMDSSEPIAHAVNVEGTLRLARLSSQAGVQNFIFLSSQSALPDAVSAYGKSKHAAEQALLALDDLNIIILRPGLVTGPGSRGLFRRMTRMVESLPIVPLIGAASIVQPIHVDDLCEAVFRCDEAKPAAQTRIVKLGDPLGITLAEFLKKIALVSLRRRRVFLPIPLWPVEMVLRLTEAVGIHLPINSNNIRGLKTVELMETTADLDRLNLRLRTIDEMIRNDVDTSVHTIPLGSRPVRVLLIGAGRIGLVHALTLSRLSGVFLCGIVDPNRRSTGLLRGLGVSSPAFQDLDEALSKTNPDAVVIATPPATHLSLARSCLKRRMAVLIEKPLASRKEQLADYARLANERGAAAIQVGYVMVRCPQVSTLLDRLRSGSFGKVQGFLGVTLLSFIQNPHIKRWEVTKAKSGGGAFINSGGHVLSMIYEAFGEPLSLESENLKLFSTEVEDSMVVSLNYQGFQGVHYCTWSIEGVPRQENKLVIWTEQGHLILTGSVGVFVSNEGEVDIKHQLDFDVGFNLAPDYAGAGFSNELNDLKEAALNGKPAPVSLAKTITLEHLLFRAYDASREVKSFKAISNEYQSGIVSTQQERLLSKEAAKEETSKDVRQVLDLRELSSEEAGAYLGSIRSSPIWNEYQINSGHMRNETVKRMPHDILRVTVPDFLTQSRLLSMGRYGDVIADMGVRGTIASGSAAVPLLMRERGVTFWVAATGLLAAALAAVPRDFEGRILLHGYITDLALTLRRVDRLNGLLSLCHRMRPRARIGIHTNLGADALNALQTLGERIDDVSLLTSPHALRISEFFTSMRRVHGQRELSLTAEVGLAPDIVQRVAFRTPTAWAHGADALLIGAGAEAVLADQRRRRFHQEWSRVFPGLTPPQDAI